MSSLDGERVAKQLSLLLDDVETLQKKLTARVNEDTFQDRIPDGLIDEVRTLAASAVSLSKEARAWAKQHKDTASKLSQAERIELTYQFISKLNESDKRSLIGRIYASLSKRAPEAPQQPKAEPFQPWVQEG